MSLKQPVLYSGINTLPNLHTFNLTNVAVETCMCGYKPVIGEPFYYKSKYSDTILIGIVKQIRPADIISMNGTSYKKSEISIRPVDIRRDDILNELGI
jgi:hypothetical protein